MRATEAIQEVTQVAGPPGQPTTTRTRTVCPVCRQPVAAYRKTRRGELFRRHVRRLPNGRKCPHGLTHRDPAGTRPAF